jgi:putative FmdB family regulatory protein
MPTYEYRCERCGHGVEVVQSFTDSALTTCESCGGHLRKVYAPVGIVFKGSGFYKTDSRSSSKSAKGASSSSDGSTEKKDTEKKDGDKKDAKKDGVASTPAKADGSGASSPTTPATTGAAKKD